MKHKLLIISLAFLALASCKTPEARKPVSQNSGSFFKESVKRNQQLVAQEEERISEIIQKDTAHNYISSSDGFWYYYNQKSTQDSISPDYGDLVNFNYNISTLEGTSIYSTEEIGTREYKIDQENVFNGLRQGLKMMKEGETLTFLFPSHKAFGYYGDNEKIGRNVPIKSTITLNKITKEDKLN
ncbi:gliding motility-associated peptidyl-prolyl isomerase GldI [Mesonia aestuariivivens]|uniref:Peptidyl-prolyl cis-trans isomerase n=1 Tax=Mesonia aestuariivivens TaxID=2796128 RepID=A0ABS6W000_9FLAO|nr:gliding motility-associated peptidyl-prolyl isomerase GldI [Mesonia aestuariivivens]MBW2961161.1 gliding motility-associated peptidyl-prolyl isomerase GldI [Mesonia aestuariivivens]